MIFIQRLWHAIAGVLTLGFVAHFLSPTEQGYFYTLSSIAALHMALDMGLSTVLVQFASREFVGVSWSVRYGVEGEQAHRYLALVRLSLRWYFFAALAFLLAYPLGILFIEGGQGVLSYDWRGPWALLVCSTVVNFLFLPALALTEGSGAVKEVYAVRLVQGVMGAAAAWSVLIIGGGLYALAMLPAASAVVAAVWLFSQRRMMLVQAFHQFVVKFDWATEVWPLQWRIGASWLAGYALVLMHVPLLFRTQGAITAGQMGVTMTVANMLSLLALSWMTAQLPAMARAVATKEWAQLDHIFWRACRVSCAAFAAGAGMFVVVRWYLESTPYDVRFLPTEETIGLLFAMGFYHVSGLFAAYLRSHLQEPFLWPSLIGALLTAIAAIGVAPLWGAQGIVIVLLMVNGLFFFPAAVGMWIHYRRKWHAMGT